ncbi:MAG: hypothetical protein ACK4Q5_05325 [Saprospiraceae bacterium]
MYQSDKAIDFADSKTYPIGFEAIFANDGLGKDFAVRFSQSVQKQPANSVLFKLEGSETDVARGIDCFFSSADALRRVLNESLPDAAFYHEEEGKVIPKVKLVDEAKKITQNLSVATRA